MYIENDNKQNNQTYILCSEVQKNKIFKSLARNLIQTVVYAICRAILLITEINILLSTSSALYDYGHIVYICVLLCAIQNLIKLYVEIVMVLPNLNVLVKLVSENTDEFNKKYTTYKKDIYVLVPITMFKLILYVIMIFYYYYTADDKFINVRSKYYHLLLIYNVEIYKCFLSLGVSSRLLFSD